MHVAQVWLIERARQKNLSGITSPRSDGLPRAEVLESIDVPLHHASRCSEDVPRGKEIYDARI